MRSQCAGRCSCDSRSDQITARYFHFYILSVRDAGIGNLLSFVPQTDIENIGFGSFLWFQDPDFQSRLLGIQKLFSDKRVFIIDIAEDPCSSDTCFNTGRKKTSFHSIDAESTFIGFFSFSIDKTCSIRAQSDASSATNTLIRINYHIPFRKFECCFCGALSNAYRFVALITKLRQLNNAWFPSVFDQNTGR